MGSKNQTSSTQQSSTTSPSNLAGLQDIFNRIQQVSQTPYQPYGGQLTAGLSPTQTAGISNVNAAYGTAQPYLNTAAGYAASGASPISSSQISNYLNPYTQDVINATQANFNENNAEQQQQVVGNAAMQGAGGGDRQAVAQAELARQQSLAENPTIAGLEQNNYSQALSAAQQDRSAQQYGAGAFAGLGSEAQNAALQGAQAQIGAGGLEQGTNQQALNALYQQYQLGQAFPYQQAQYFEQYGLPAALSQGQTTSGYGTSTQPGPNIFSQLLGLGVAGAGLFSPPGGGHAFGGAIRRADGGPTSIFDVQGFIPTSKGPSNSTLQGANLNLNTLRSGNNNSNSPLGQGSLGGLRGLFGGSSDMGSPGVDSPLMVYGGAGDYGVPTFTARGGRVGYDDGGSIDARFPLAGDINAGADVMGDPNAASAALRAYGLGNPTTSLPSPYDSDTVAQAPVVVPLPQPRPTSANVAAADDDEEDDSTPLPAAITGGAGGPSVPASALSYDSTGAGNAGTSPLSLQSAAQTDQAPQSGGGLFHLSDNARMALIAAGLGMAASRSPFALTAIGEGGLQGLNTYQQSLKADQAAKQQQVTQQQAQTRIDQEAQRISNQAEQWSKTFKSKGEMTDYQKALVAQKSTEDAIKLKTPVKIGEGITGQPIMAMPKLNAQGGVDMYPIGRDGTISTTPLAPGQSVNPQAPTSVAPTNSPTAQNTPPPAPDTTSPDGTPAGGRNEKFLGQVAQEDPGYAAAIKKAADYELDPNRYASMRTAQRQKFYDNVLMYDPTFNPSQYGLRYQAQRAFLPGTKVGDTVRSFNVAISHLDTLRDLYTALQSGDTQAINRVRNVFQTQFGYEAPNNLAGAAQLVGGEVVKATVGSQNALGDRDELRKTIDPALAQGQALGIIKTYTNLMGGQVRGIKKQYEEGTGLNNFEQKYLLPRTVSALRAAEGEAAGVGGGNAPLREGMTGTRSDGTRVIVRNGIPVPLQQ